ncbi:MAG TPA: hypothetical protein VJ904_03490 [Tichowtungia sp.]|nr:hypothetical protein [Tichowtungia sp.]
MSELGEKFVSEEMRHMAELEARYEQAGETFDRKLVRKMDVEHIRWGGGCNLFFLLHER